MHVPDGVDVHAERHEGDDAHHHHGERVDEETDLHTDAIAHEPGVDGLVEHGCALHQQLPGDERGQQERGTDGGDGDDMGRGAADEPPEEPGEDRCGERQQRDGEQGVRVDHGGHHINPSGCRGLRR